MIEKVKLREHALLLENAIASHAGENDDVDFLASFDPLLKAIGDAKNGKIDVPLSLGLSRWELESNICDVREVAHRLAQFELLLEGWSLPSDQG